MIVINVKYVEQKEGLKILNFFANKKTIWNKKNDLLLEFWSIDYLRTS